jgi:gluconolactonase
MPAPNGIGLSPDESKLIVANSGGGKNSYWMEFSIMQDGTLDDGKYYYKTTEAERTERGGPDGLVIRDDGVMFATGPGGVWIFSAEGEHLGTVKTGQATSNCTIGDGGRYLFITADMYLMRIRLK